MKKFQNVGIGDWGLGIGDWGLGPNPQSPIPNPQYKNIIYLNISNKYLNNLKKVIIFTKIFKMEK